MHKGSRIFLSVTLAGALLFLSVLSVYAAPPAQDTQTPTVTITSQGAYVPTIQPTMAADDFACGTGTPVGYGTVTPDGLWSVLCSSCMPLEGLETSTPNPTSYTPTVTGTPPTPTSTPNTGPALISCGSRGDNGVSCTEIDAYTVRLTIVSSGSAQGIFWGSVESFDTATWYVELHSLVYTVGQWYDTTIYPETSLVGGLLDDGGMWYPPISYTSTYLGCGGGCRYYDFNVGTYERVIEDVLPGDHLFWVFSRVGGSAWWDTNGMYAIISSVPTGGTATPTPGPSGGYCTVVNGGGEPASEGFSWSGITYGSQYCFDIGPLDQWDWGIVNLANIGLPWIAHICLQEIDIGVIEIFGVSVSLLVVAYVVGIAWIIRNMFVS